MIYGQHIVPSSPLDFPFGPFASCIDAGAEEGRVNDYDPIADVFDDIMASDFHAATHEIRRQIARRVLTDQDINCLDLACGTGLFFDLLSRDFQIHGYGVDLSLRQIQVATTRRRLTTVDAQYRQGDIIEVDFPERLDLVTINFDALNHIRSASLWRHIFEKSYRALRSGGALLLDVNLPVRLAQDWNAPEVIIKERLAYIQIASAPIFEGANVTRRIQMMVFKQSIHRTFSRLNVVVEQFAMPLNKTIDLLSGCGFGAVDVISAPTSKPVRHIFNKNRAFLCAWK